MGTTQSEPKNKSGLSDKVNTMPDGWDLSSIPERPDTTRNSQIEPASHEDHETSSELDAKERADWQLDPHFDRRLYPSRRDLSAY